VVGSITQVSPAGVTVSASNQGSMTFTVDSADITSGFVVGDVVDVSYTQNGAVLDAGDVEYVEADATVTVTAAGTDRLTITDDATGQPKTFTADPSLALFDGVSVGDQVDVTYHQSSGQLVADALDDQAGNWSVHRGGPFIGLPRLIVPASKPRRTAEKRWPPQSRRR
jgi:hypothetical protein